MTKTKGTPKTLTEAIQNGLLIADEKRQMDISDAALIAFTIEVRIAVIDFLAQRAGVFMLSVGDKEAQAFADTFWEQVKNSGK